MALTPVESLLHEFGWEHCIGRIWRRWPSSRRAFVGDSAVKFYTLVTDDEDAPEKTIPIDDLPAVRAAIAAGAEGR